MAPATNNRAIRRQLTRSEFARAILRIGNNPLVFDAYPYMRTMYDCYLPEVVFMTARQIGKSTTWCSFLVTDSLATSGFKSLYVTPSREQTTYFSNNRLRPMIKDSPYIMKNFYNKELMDNVLNCEFPNKSAIHLRYAYLTADRIRGMSVDSIFYDEIQDILTDLIPIIKETTFRSKFSWSRYSGTPKTFSNTLTKFWEGSTQMKWAVKCEHCNKFDFLDDPMNIGQTGPICKGCGGKVDPKNGLWVKNNASGKYPGFHVSQLMIPIQEHQWWDKILSKYEGPSAYPKHMLYNEVLGLPYDTADTPVTLHEVKACCDPALGMIDRAPTNIGGYPLTMGIDWGFGISSYTIATVGYQDGQGRYHIIWAKKYVSPLERDFRVQIPDIVKFAYLFRVKAIGADWGAGVDRISEMRVKIPDIPTFAFQSTNSSRKLYYDPRDDIFRHSRTQTMTDRFVEIRNQLVVFPRWEEFQGFAEDILNVFVDYGSTGNLRNVMIYDHAIDRPDDFMHAWNYAKMASDVLRVDSFGAL